MLFLWHNGGGVVRRTLSVGCFADVVVSLFGGCERGHALCWGAATVQVCPATGWPVVAESRMCEVVVNKMDF